MLNSDLIALLSLFDKRRGRRGPLLSDESINTICACVVLALIILCGAFILSNLEWAQ